MFKQNRIQSEKMFEENEFQESDNPLKHILSSDFLKTELLASHNKLTDNCDYENFKAMQIICSPSKQPKKLQIFDSVSCLDNSTTQELLLTDKIDRQDFGGLKNCNKLDTQYEMCLKVGQGSFGKVYQAINKLNNKIHAVKILPKNIVSQQSQVQILAQCDHPNIVRLIQIFQEHHTVYLVMEYCMGGSIFNFMKNNRQKPSFYLFLSDEQNIRSVIKQILSGLTYLHNKKIIHGDLKFDNMAFSQKIESNSCFKDNIIKLIDFGLSKKLQYKVIKTKQKSGSLRYVSPQALDGWISQKSDIWSCGIILYTLCHKKFPFANPNKQKLKQMIRQRQITFDDPIWDSISTATKQLISRMLDKNYTKRPTAKQCLDCSFVTGKINLQKQ